MNAVPFKVPSYVYFIQAGHGGPIKIGFSSTSVERRIIGNQVGCPQKIELLGVIEGDVSLEARFHKAFRSCALRGEWFNPHPHIMAFIAKIAQPLQQPTFDDEPHPLRRARLRLGLTQDDVAKKIGINCSMISQIEGRQRTPSLHIAVLLTNLLGLRLTPDLAEWMIRKRGAAVQ